MPNGSSILAATDRGLYCAAGDFYIDPWQPVDRALITHAHSDHAKPGHTSYLCAHDGVELLRRRVDPGASITGVAYGDTLALRDARVSFHPAGHVLGSAQIRVEHRGEVWVVSGDYKTVPDPTCPPFEPLKCHTFITESTFALPIYRWPDQKQIFDDVNAWWRSNQQQNRTSVLFGYALGKAQRLLAGVDASLGPILAHGAVRNFLPAYAAAGVALPAVQPANRETVRAASGQALVLAPPAADESIWLKSFGDISTAFASGWMLIRGTRRRRSADRGFPLSDHADWPGLLAAIQATEAERVLVTHGTAGPLARWLKEKSWQAGTIVTQFSSDPADEEAGD